MRGILFDLSVCVARHFHADPKDYCLLCLVRRSRRIRFTQRMTGLRTRQAVRMMCCSMSSALLGVGVFKLKGMNWPTLQSLYRKTILGVAKEHVCSLVYKFEVSCGGRWEGGIGSANRTRREKDGGALQKFLSLARQKKRGTANRAPVVFQVKRSGGGTQTTLRRETRRERTCLTERCSRDTNHRGRDLRRLRPGRWPRANYRRSRSQRERR